MGLALARRLLAGGAEVTIAGRSADRLAAAQPGNDLLRTRQVDVTSEDQVQRLLADATTVNHVVVTAVDVAGAYAPMPDFSLGAARAVIDTKLMGPWLVAKHFRPAVPQEASITFTSGVAAYRPGPGSSMIAATNGALESLARALAVELAPIRVNVVSPGWIDTPVWDVLAGNDKDERFSAMAQRLPAGRIGLPDDVAEAFLAVLQNKFMTGALVHVDGGQRLV